MPITRTPIINDDGSMTIGTVFENAWKFELYDQIDAAIAKAAGPAWVPYTPLWQAGSGTQPVAGNSTLNGAYVAQGPIVHVRIRLVIGSTAVFAGTAFWRLSLPPAYPAPPAISGLVGHANLAGRVPDLISQTSFSAFLASNQNWVSATLPAAWAVGDSMEIWGSYPTP